MTLFSDLKKKHAIRKYLSQGQTKLTQKDPEGAYEQYLQAADLGSAEAMLCIAKLYYSGDFRAKNESNLMELFSQGMPAFPWNMVNRTVPDYASALEWFRKAADLGNAAAACMAGSMLCGGVGCRQKNKAAGLPYLEKAASAGIQQAKNGLFLYREHPKKTFAQEEYMRLLRQFSEAAAAEKDEAYVLYDQLKGAQPALLAKLGYVLMAAQNSGKQGFSPFEYSTADSGIPLIPACAKRGAWRSFIRVDLNALASDDVRIAFSSDIDADFTLGYSQRLVRTGSAVYRSPAFGWLGEEKHAVLFRIDRDAQLRGEELQTVVEQFCLIEEEYQPENAAFLTECGEKEYSVEIAAIVDGKADVLFRYTIGGSDTVNSYFEPEVLSVTEE